VNAQPAEVPADQLSREERQILAVRAAGDSTAVAIDFRQLFAEGQDAYRQTVHAGDRLDVPERRSQVVVLGAVREPGILPYVPGQGVDAYLARAGGAVRRADVGRTVIVRARTGTRERARDNNRVDEGDTVILPYRTETTFTQGLQVAGTVVGTITGLILSAIAIFR